MATFQENLRTLRPIDGVDSITLYRCGQQIGSIPNIDGKRGSLQVYANLVGFEDGVIDYATAARGLELFAEHTATARSRPGQHPNIDILLGVTEDAASNLRAVINYRQPE